MNEERDVRRVAALYDIHGNLPALESVLRDIRRDDVELIVVGGDVVPGPMPMETLAYLHELDLPVRFIRGNGEREILARIAGMATGSVPERFRGTMDWVAGQFGSDEERAMSAWPATFRVGIEGLGEVLFCHATPRSDAEIFTRLTPDDHLAPVFAGLDVPLVVCGHTHMQFDRTVGSVRVVNAGSVGMPYGKPGAYWLLLGPDVELRRSDYDLAHAAERIRRTAYPQAHEFATRNVLEPPSESETLALFGKAEMK